MVANMATVFVKSLPAKLKRALGQRKRVKVPIAEPRSEATAPLRHGKVEASAGPFHRSLRRTAQPKVAKRRRPPADLA
jgi:hypothetical protein